MPYPPTYLRRGHCVFRTYPIRVGNTDGFSSGDWYADQREVDWKDISMQNPEFNYGRTAGLAARNWSGTNLADSVMGEQPDALRFTYLGNYLNNAEQLVFYETHRRVRQGLNEHYKFIFGHGPRVENVET